MHEKFSSFTDIKVGALLDYHYPDESRYEKDNSSYPSQSPPDK